MTKDDAKRWLAERYDAAALDRLADYVDLLLAEADRQNLISAATVPSVWTRHIVDSAQLLDHAPSDWKHWVDIGAGAGLPGLVVAALSKRAVTLIEPRKLRVEFLQRSADTLGLSKVQVIHAKAERVFDIAMADVISARAVAKLEALLAASRGFVSKRSVFILPKGESAQSEVASASRTWHGTFHVKHSIVDPNSGIVVASGVAAR
ncbi:16S rRNA (guanine(527)-N(7))-methyltransferase RsmG [uncultured Sphingomonas sp.]|uniref:16S rRNA (guanine(527)-N(7))-methyltransferase RsmG n=1 Tax=uncultured Sphingomonas sp. TaxID=158754 RepID=UPI0025D5782A|nr:16S rRNA (guanine(527)-N(7))-methyltransferase RsmG [uncultured Sphingomonas sp.]